MDYNFRCDILNPFLKGPPGLLAAALIARTVRCLCATLASQFYRFLARFSGRRRQKGSMDLSNFAAYAVRFPPPFRSQRLMPPPLATLVLFVSTVLSITEACSSRSTPKPRPPFPTARPNITFLTYECPPAYAEWFCLNEATCFTVKIGDSLLYNCECADGYMGQRCEYKDLDGSYLRSQQRVMLETASIAGGATIAVFLVVIMCVALYIHFRRKQKEQHMRCVNNTRGNEEIRPFSRPLAIPIQQQTVSNQNEPPVRMGKPELSGTQAENNTPPLNMYKQ